MRETREGPPWMPARVAITRSTRAAARPRGVLGRRGAGDRLVRAADARSSIRARACTAAGSSAACATRAGTRSTVTSSPAARSRRRSSTTRPSPTPSRRSPTRSCRRRTQVLAGILKDFGVAQGRPRHHLHADGPGGRRRHARVRADRRGSLRRVRRVRGQRARHPHRRRQAEGHPLRELRHRADAASSRTSRCSTARSSSPTHKPEACLILQRPQCEATLVAGRDHDWKTLWDRAPASGKSAVRVRAGRRRPIRSTSSTPPARPASPRASCATTAATWSR